jgi:perosamine synthetase
VPGDGSAAQEIPAAPSTASTDLRAEAASFGLPEGFVVELFAAEPDVKNPVAFSVDEKGDVYVCESFRQEKGITDNRGHDRNWVEADLAAQTVADRIAYHRRLLGSEVGSYERHEDRVRRLVDSDGDALGLDPIALRAHLSATASIKDNQLFNAKTGRRISALVPMHTFGHPMQIAKLVEVASEFKLTIVEDAAESLGSFVANTHTGTFGKCGVFSFNGNKTITTGGGGAILTNDAELAKKIRHLATTAKLAHDWEYIHDAVAFNYRMPNINAALGCAQLDRLDSFLKAKRKLATKYSQAFSECDTLSFVAEPNGTTSNYWLNTIRLNAPDLQTRDELLSAARADGYLCRPAWNLLHTLPMYVDAPRADLPVAQRLWQSLINIPSSARHCLGDI